jgi:hypothetical protein
MERTRKSAKFPTLNDHAYARRARVGEPWDKILADALGEITGKLLAADAWRIVGKPYPRRRSQDDCFRLGRAMRDLGWRRSMRRFGGVPRSAYVRGDSREEINRDVYVFWCPIFGGLAITHSRNPTNEEFRGRIDARAPAFSGASLAPLDQPTPDRCGASDSAYRFSREPVN